MSTKKGKAKPHTITVVEWYSENEPCCGRCVYPPDNESLAPECLGCIEFSHFKAKEAP